MPLTCGFFGGRYWVRTSDLFGVNEARYHCANRPCTRRLTDPGQNSKIGETAGKATRKLTGIHSASDKARQPLHRSTQLSGLAKPPMNHSGVTRIIRANSGNLGPLLTIRTKRFGVSRNLL